MPVSGRKPQINFQVDEPLKILYDEAKLSGHHVTRLCAAGLLLMIENPAARVDALARLRAWEARYADATADDVRGFLEGLEAALQGAARETRPAPAARGAARAGRRGRSG